MKKPDSADARRCIELRKRSKTGIINSKEDQEFVMKMYDKYPDWYHKTEDDVFNETAPFGSNVKRKNGKTVYE